MRTTSILVVALATLLSGTVQLPILEAGWLASAAAQSQRSAGRSASALVIRGARSIPRDARGALNNTLNDIAREQDRGTLENPYLEIDMICGEDWVYTFPEDADGNPDYGSGVLTCAGKNYCPGNPGARCN